jgi:uncharacterized protein YuzE
MASTVTSSTRDFIAACSAMASDMLRLPARHVWVDYDREADVLYMSFRKPQGATKTIELDEDTLVRKDGRTIVGLTIMNASTRQEAGNSGRTKLPL